MAAAIPGVRATRTTPVPSARTPAASGGRFGPQRTTSSRANRTRTGRPCSSASRRATSPTSLVTLPPKAPPLASAVAGSPPGHAPRRVGLEVAGLHPRRAQRARPLPGRQLDRPTQRGRGPPALHLAGRGAGLGERLPDHPLAADRSHRDEGVERRGVVGEAAPAQRHLGADDLRRAHPRASPSAPRRPPIGDPVVRRSRRRTATAASRIVCQPVHRHRWARSAWSTAASVGGPRAARPGQAHDDPRRAEPALAGARGSERLRPRDRRPPARRRWSPGVRPPAGPASRRPRGAGRRPAPCSSRTVPAGCSRPSGTGRPGGPAGPRAASSRRRAPRRAVHRPRRRASRPRREATRQRSRPLARLGRRPGAHRRRPPRFGAGAPLPSRRARRLPPELPARVSGRGRPRLLWQQRLGRQALVQRRRGGGQRRHHHGRGLRGRRRHLAQPARAHPPVRAQDPRHRVAAGARRPRRRERAAPPREHTAHPHRPHPRPERRGRRRVRHGRPPRRRAAAAVLPLPPLPGDGRHLPAADQGPARGHHDDRRRRPRRTSPSRRSATRCRRSTPRRSRTTAASTRSAPAIRPARCTT